MRAVSKINGITATIILAVVVACFIASFQVMDTSGSSDPGPAAYPRLVLVVIGACAIGMFFEKDEQKGALFTRQQLISVGSVLLALAVYILLLPALGYILATSLFVGVLVVLAGERRALVVALYAIVFSLAMYFVFSEFLSIVLPRGIVEGILP